MSAERITRTPTVPMLSKHSRERAAALGLTHYFTGEPCRHGHIAERYTNSGNCLECNHARVTKWNAANRKHVREMKRKRRAANLEKAREREREYARRLRAAERWKERHRRWRAAWDAKNKDKVAAQRAARRAANPEKAREYARGWYARNKDRMIRSQRLAAITNEAARPTR
jgi:hypothetical protein